MATKPQAHPIGFARGFSFAALLDVFRKKPASQTGGIVALGGDDFAQFQACMTAPRKPTKAMLAAEDMHRKMRKS